MRIFFVLLASTLMIVGCGGKKAASKKNFEKALNAHFLKEGPECLRVKWPVLLSEREIKEVSWGHNPGERMEALVKVGLFEKEETKGKKSSYSDEIIPLTRYTLSEKGKTFIQGPEEKTSYKRAGETIDQTKASLCYGQPRLDKVIKWDEPWTDGVTRTTVYYTYNLDDLEDWVKDPAIQKAFFKISGSLEDLSEEQKDILKLTSEGWEVGRR